MNNQTAVRGGDSGSDGFIRYLPSVYHDNDFLRRYLAIYEDIYLAIERYVENQPDRCDPELASPEKLLFLASCVGWPDPGLWPPERLREALKHSGELTAMRGTRAGLISALTFYTGREPYVVEHFIWNDAANGMRCPALFSDNPYAFTVLVNERLSEAEYAGIVKVTGAFAPAHAEARVVCLEPCFKLDGHSYLDINAYLIAEAKDEQSGLSLV